MTRFEEASVAFADECRFAKLVRTPRGDAMLIGGVVIELAAPPFTPGEAQPNYTQAIVTALRRSTLPEATTGAYGIVGAGHVGTAAGNAA